MPGLPSHPDTDSSGPSGPPRSEQAAAGRSRLRGALLIVGAAALVVVILVLHLTGVVGAGSHW